MRTHVLALTLGYILLAGTVAAQTADEIVAKYIKAVGGADAIGAITTLRQTGKYFGGGGFQALYVQVNKRSGKVREEWTYSGLTGVYAFDGQTGWKIEPWGGKKDPEPLDEEESKSIVEDADFDGPLVNYRQKGNIVEFIGMEPVEGTNTYKLKVTFKTGDVQYFFLDQETCMPIKIEIQRTVRGAQKYYELWPGEYKLVAGWYVPFSMETNVKGSPDKGKTSFETIEANVPSDDARFTKPGGNPR
jgi:hypothetical protein